MKIYISNRKNINRLIATKFLAIFMMIYSSSEVSGKTSTLFEKTPFDKVEGNSMLGLLSLLGFGDKSKKQYVTSSPIEGYIYKHGAPVANARIVRKVRSNENPDWVGDEFKTDEKGYFNLPVREEVYSLGMSQFVSATKVVVESGGELVDFWYSNSLVGELYAEFGGSELKELTCELTDEEIIINGRFHNILTKCKWKNMPKTDD